jgi:hypothetical protein
MRAWLGLLCGVLACGGTVTDVGDGGDAGDAAVKDVVTEKDAQPLSDAGDAGDAGDGGSGLGLNVSGEGPGYESEDQIAVAPDGTIAILWQAFTQTPPYFAMRYAFSTDDGKTFSAPKNIVVGGGLYPGDPALTVDASGNFWASYLAIAYSGQTVAYSDVYVAEAPHGSLYFGAGTLVSTANNSTDLNDHPKIFATKTGTLLVGWADYPSATAGTGVVARSTDGQAWTRTTLVDNNEASFATFFWFCEGASHVYTTFLEGTSQLLIGTRASADDGATFTSTTVVASPPSDEVAALDPACAADGDDLWVMYPTTHNPSVDETTIDPADHLWLAHSPDDGATFDTTHLDTLDLAATTLATLPILVRDPAGKLDVAYVAGNTAGDTNGSIRFTRTDGVTVGPSTFVDGPMTFDLSRVDQGWLGDYFGSVARAGALYLAYPRNETGLDHIYFAKMPLP